MMESIAPKSDVLEHIVEHARKNKNPKAKRLMKPAKQNVQTNERAGNPRLNFLKKIKFGPGMAKGGKSLMGGRNFQPNDEPNEPDEDDL